MADWTRRFAASYRWMRVSRATGLEVERLTNLRNGGTVSRNQDTDYETGTVDFAGSLDLGPDLLRVYLDARDLRDGTVTSEPIATMVASVPKVTRSGRVATGTAALRGRLCEVAEDELDGPVSVPAGTNAVAYAAGILRGAGLTVVAEASDYTLASHWVLGLDDALRTRLKAANKLLEAAGFRSAACDPMGRVVLRRYVDLAQRPVAATLAEGAGARFEDSCTDERDASDVANVVHAAFSTSDVTVRGTAVDSDPGSPYSTASRGYRKAKSYSYDYLPAGSTDAERQAAADARAAELLATQQSVIRRVTVRHVYAPLSVGDAVEVRWPTAGISGRFGVRRMDLTLAGGCPMELELRRYER